MLRLRKQAYRFHLTSLKCRTERQAITDDDLNETLGNNKNCLRQKSTGFEGCFNMHTYNSKQSESETVSNLSELQLNENCNYSLYHLPQSP